MQPQPTLASTHKFPAAMFAALMICLVGPGGARADIRPAVKISMARESAQPAVAGQVYEGLIEVFVAAEGTLADFALEQGAGWDDASLNVAEQVILVPGEILEIPFSAVPVDVSTPLRFSLTYNGRKLSRAFKLSAQDFETLRKGHPLIRLPDGGAGDQGDNNQQRRPQGACSNMVIHFSGRFVYTRTGLDLDGDGIDEIPPEIVGADNITVRITTDFHDRLFYGDGHAIMRTSVEGQDGPCHLTQPRSLRAHR